MDKIFTLEELEQDTSFIKYCTGTDAAAKTQWEAYVKAHPAETATVLRAKATVLALHAMLGDIYSMEAAEEFRQLLLQRHGQPGPDAVDNPPLSSKRRLAWIAAAAVLLLLVAAGGALLFRRAGKTPPAVVQQIETRYGTKSKQVLPDGTTVWLNAGSRLSYASREATLEGEAFFDVAKDPEHPFVVRTGDITIEVLGTAFNIKAYRGEKNIEATLFTGSISVQLDRDPGKKIMLSPNEKLIIPRIPRADSLAKKQPSPLKYQVQTVVKPENSPYYAERAWVDNTLVFNNEKFADVALRLERWYNVKIRFENKRLEQEELSGIFDQENIQQALQILQMTTRFRYRMEGDEIVIF